MKVAAVLGLAAKFSGVDASPVVIWEKVAGKSHVPRVKILEANLVQLWAANGLEGDYAMQITTKRFLGASASGSESRR